MRPGDARDEERDAVGAVFAGGFEGFLAGGAEAGGRESADAGADARAEERDFDRRRVGGGAVFELIWGQVQNLAEDGGGGGELFDLQ